jgi:hypothetical protein
MAVNAIVEADLAALTSGDNDRQSQTRDEGDYLDRALRPRSLGQHRIALRGANTHVEPLSDRFSLLALKVCSSYGGGVKRCL